MNARTAMRAVVAVALCGLFAQSVVGQQAVPDNIVIPPAPEQPIAYSHKQHLDLGLPCANCHMNPKRGAEMGLPADSVCMTCHAAISADKASIQELKSYVDRGEAVPWKRVYEINPGITWSHRTHADAGLQCETCHGDVQSLEVMTQLTAVTAMATCISCHQAHEAGANCQVCHAWPPEDLLGKD